MRRDSWPFVGMTGHINHMGWLQSAGRDGSGWFLGLGGSKHDYAACLVRDGRIEIAIEEERITRRKRGFGVDVSRLRCIAYCLDACSLSLDDISAVCVNDLLDVGTYQNIRRPKLIFGHHLTHAASAFFPSELRDAAVLIIDHSGGRYVEEGRLLAETFSYYHGTPGGLRLLGRISGEDESGATSGPTVELRGNRGVDLLKRPRNSIGRFYARISRKCGCVSRMGDGQLHTESGKMMGLAAHGDDRFYERLRTFIELTDEGQVAVSMGPPNAGVEKLCDEILAETTGAAEEDFKARASLAWAAQKILEEVMLHCARHLHQATGSRNLCLAGGVALNGLGVHNILENTPFERVFVQPAAHDAGTALGAALLGWRASTSPDVMPPERFSVYLGRRYRCDELLGAVREQGVPYLTLAKPAAAIARSVVEGKVVGLFQGRSEFGPRALGNRSVLGDARRKETRDRLDQKIKFREAYRPYAPAVRAEEVDRFFQIQCPSPHMTVIGQIRPEWRHCLPSITHVDGTVRVQVVSADSNPLLYAVLNELAILTGIGVVLNTSMNIQGEPIVESPADAVRFLCATAVDLLFLEDLICTRHASDLEPWKWCALQECVDEPA